MCAPKKGTWQFPRELGGRPVWKSGTFAHQVRVFVSKDIHPTKAVQIIMRWCWPWIDFVVDMMMTLDFSNTHLQGWPWTSFCLTRSQHIPRGVRFRTRRSRKEMAERYAQVGPGHHRWGGMVGHVCLDMVDWDKYTPVKEHSTWKWMFGILISILLGNLFSGAMLVLGRVGVSPPHENEDVPPKKGNTFSGNVYLFQPLGLREMQIWKSSMVFRWGKFNPKN